MTAKRPRRRLSLAVAALLPAALAAAAVLLFVPPRPEHAPREVPRGNASRLASLAGGSRELRPIVLRGNRSELGTGPSGGSLTDRRGAGVPERLAIPELHVNAPIQAVNSTPAGIAVPPIGHAGWYEAGPRPGDPGRAVVIGHIDGKTLPGVFEHVPEIRKGAEVDVIDREDGVHRFAVVGKLQVSKRAFPASAVYGASPRPVLVLVTCGGVYVPGEGYSDNVIVYARALS